MIERFRTLTEEVLLTLTEEDPFSAKVYASFNQFQAQAYQYAAITEKRFYNELQVE